MTDTPITSTLVLGATGRVGRRLVPRLAARGVAVSAASRHPGPEQTLFDWDRPETHDPALAGVDAVFVVLPELVEDPSAVVAGFVDRAAAAGVRRLVLLTALGIEWADGADTGFGRTEAVVRASDLEWTILRPASFDQNFSEGFLLPGIRERGVVKAPTGDGAAPLVDAEDIAAVAAAVLTEDGHAKAEYAVTGPEALTFAEAAAIIGAAIGRTVVHEDAPRQALLDGFADFGSPPEYAEMVARTYDAIRAGRATAVSPDVARVTGRPATPFRDYVSREASAWA
jgi:uncharacterized protein YbjT (DUF2867 family)